MAALEKSCPRCHTSSYHNPNLKLLVNVCGHKLCEVCVDSVFTRPTAACPECGYILRRNQYRIQQFEDSEVEKEVDIRKRIVKDFNKCEDDFSTLAEYNDYLEEVETIIFNLANGIDVDQTKQKVETYRTENQTLIMKNRAKQLRQEQALNSQLKLQKFEERERTQKALEEDELALKKKQKAKELLLDELMNTSRSAKDVISEYNTKHQSTEQSGMRTKLESGPVYQADQVGVAVFDPLPEMDTGELYHYDTPMPETHGPPLPDMRSIKWSPLDTSKDASKTGGGFTSAQACQRLLEEAYSCLFLLDKTN